MREAIIDASKTPKKGESPTPPGLAGVFWNEWRNRFKFTKEVFRNKKSLKRELRKINDTRAEKLLDRTNIFDHIYDIFHNAKYVSGYKRKDGKWADGYYRTNNAWTSSRVDYARVQRHSGKTYRSVANALNLKYETSFTESSVATFLRRHPT